MIRLRSTAVPAVLVAFVLASTAFWGCGPGFPDEATGSFDFTTGAFSFNNFDDSVSGGQMTPALAARLFGDAAVCVTGAGSTCVPLPAAQVWIDEVNAQLAFGHSEGLAVLSLLMSLGQVNPADFGGATASQLSLDNAALRAELAYWAATQKVQAVHATDQKLTAKEALAFLAKVLPDKAQGWRLLLAVRDASGFRAGHAVVPFGYFRGTKDGQYFIRIYDPNFPAEERRIEVNIDANTWRYEGSPNPEQPRTYEGTAANGNLLYFSSVTARQGTFTPSFVEGFAASASGAVFVEGAGVQVGFQNGQPVEVGGTLMPGAADCFCKAPTGITNVMVAGSGPRTVTVGPDAGTLFATSPNVAAKVQPEGAAAVTIDSDAKTVTYNSTADAGTTLTTTTRNADGTSTTVTVSLDKGASGVTIDASNPQNVVITADVTTSSTNVRVTTTVTSPDGSTKTTVASGTTTGGRDVAFTVNATAGTTTVNTNVNYATCLNQKKDPMESDLDCGLFCNMQDEKNGDGRCAVAKRCASNDDCSYALASGGFSNRDFAGECVSQACASISCEDGRKNGPELDIDCTPGVRACRCSENHSCTRESDCKVGLGCYGAGSDGGTYGQCHAPTPHPLTIVGVTSDAPIAVSVSLDGSNFSLITDLSSPNGSAFVRNILAYQSMTVRFAPGFQSRYTCTFDNANAQGEWVWDRTTAPANFSNALRCVRSYQRVTYQANGQACPEEVLYRSDAGFSVVENRVSPPHLILASLHPGISVENYNSRIVNRSFNVQTGSVSVSGAYDGGLAWGLSVSAPTEGVGSFPNYTDARARAFVATLPAPKRWRYACQLNSADAGVFGGDFVAQVACTCIEVAAPDGGMDGGATDAGTTDAGATDAGAADAGVDAGMDAGQADAGSGPVCTLDTDCGAAADCFCGANSGNCAGNSGRCGAGRFVATTPTTNGVAASGTFTVPAGCTQVRVDAWGAAGGAGEMGGMFPIPNFGGAGGYVTGTLNVTAGEVFTAWVGNAGDIATASSSVEGIGSYLGTAANGGLGDGMLASDTGGSGGGLTSVLHAQSGGAQINAFVVPAGGGSGSNQPGSAAGDTGSGDLTTRPGGTAAFSSNAGGGGAGERGGSAGSAGAPGLGGSFGPLPAGFTSTPGDVSGDPGGNTVVDYAGLCGGNAGKGVTAGSAGNGCVVLRCLP